MMNTLILVAAVAATANAPVERDVVVYGSSPAALTAAVQAKRMGKSVVIVSPETRIGGLTTGGLGQTDIGNKAAFGGLALQFYRDVAAYYRSADAWKWQKRSDYLPDGQCSGSRGADSMWTFEPSAALKILEGWEKRDGLEIHRGRRLDRSKRKVKVEGGGERRRIASFETEDGCEYRGKMFVDATYEGDLMAAAGVTYVVGREANDVYGETISGNAPEAEGAWNHNINDGVSAYVKPGDKSSGLLPGVEPYDPSEKPGDGDRRVQAYCFRMCLTDVPENSIPFAKPANYDEQDYELLFRDYEAAWSRPGVKPTGARVWTGAAIPSIMSQMPNRKTDSNNRCGFSTDFIGANWTWPEASYEERERILKAHLDYQRGLMWTLANHPRIPEPVRAYFSKFGTCRDEFADGLGDGWQRQLYVREARRMVGDYVMTEHNCRGTAVAPRPVAMGAYTMDSHHVRRMETKDGFVRNEGNVEDHQFPGPYGIDYGAIVPKRGECANLFVPVCLSASHMAFGSIRMEPVFFALGQAAGTAAAQAIDAGCVVQDLDYASLARRLARDGQVMTRKWSGRSAAGDALLAVGKENADLFQTVAALRGLSFAVCADESAARKLLEAGGTNRVFLCGTGVSGCGVFDLSGRLPGRVSGIVAVLPEAVGEVRSLSRPECFVMPVSIVADSGSAGNPDGRIREFAKRISFVRPDLIAYDETAADDAAVLHAFDEMFARAGKQTPRFRDNTIRLAAVNSSAPDRAAADFLCTGEHDERIFSRAVRLLPLGGRIVLSDGDYYFDACEEEGGSAVFLDYNEGRARVITFAGVTDSKGYNTRYGAGIHVTEKAMRAMSTNGVYRVFYGAPKRPPRGDFGPYPGDFFTYTHVNNLRLENLQILFANAAKPLRGVDGSNFGSLYMRKVYIYQESYFRDRFMHIGRPDIPIAGTVGVWSVPGSNDEAAEIRYDHVQVGGLHTGFVFDGVDHLIMEVCAACRCVQGYDFRVGAKTLTLINCCDEGCTYLPVFRGKKGHVTMIDFNIERFNEKFIPVDPEGDRGEHRATEEFPGSWHGEINYTLQGGAFGFGGGGGQHPNPFWAPGHGANWKTTDQNADRR